LIPELDHGRRTNRDDSAGFFLKLNTTREANHVVEWLQWHTMNKKDRNDTRDLLAGSKRIDMPVLRG